MSGIYYKNCTRTWHTFDIQCSRSLYDDWAARLLGWCQTSREPWGAWVTHRRPLECWLSLIGRRAVSPSPTPTFNLNGNETRYRWNDTLKSIVATTIFRWRNIQIKIIEGEHKRFWKFPYTRDLCIHDLTQLKPKC